MSFYIARLASWPFFFFLETLKEGDGFFQRGGMSSLRVFLVLFFFEMEARDDGEIWND